MSLSPSEARAARIQKYKDERRKQLTARTATLFSSNVTERRSKKISDRALSEDIGHSPSDLNLATSSVPIRTTRTSRLRAAAAVQSDQSNTSTKIKRSSSVTPATEDPKNKSPGSSQNKATRKHSREEKENIKSASTTCNVHKDGAIRSKTKHSKSKLDKDTNKLVSSPKSKADAAIEEKTRSDCSPKKRNSLETTKVNGDINIPVGTIVSQLEDDEIDELFSSLVLEDKDIQNGIELKINENVLDDLDIQSGLKSVSHNGIVPENNNGVDILQVENDMGVQNSDVSVQGGLLGVVCVRKVNRFSELLNNLCSPCEADMLFEDVLAENGLNGGGDLRTAVPECAPPCRRAQPTPRCSAGVKKATATSNDEAAGTETKPKIKQIDSHPKTESSLPSSRVSPKSTFNLPLGIKSPNKFSPHSSTSSKSHERRRSSETGSKPSCIPLSRKPAEKSSKNTSSPVKQVLTKETTNKSAEKAKPGIARLHRSPEKARSDTEANRIDKRQRAQKDSESGSEKYHYSNKRLTSLKNNSSKDDKIVKKSSKNQLKDNHKDSELGSDNLVEAISKMSTLHETVRPLASSSRLSQEMDSLAALTKQTLDRVSKLSNNLASNKINLDTAEPHFDALYASTSEQTDNGQYGYRNERLLPHRGVNERLRDIDTAAQRLIDFEKSAMFSDLNSETSSQNRRLDSVVAPFFHTPVSILKRKSIHEDNSVLSTPSHAIASPPVTFSPSVMEPCDSRLENRQRQGILKKRRSLDESQVARRRSCSPEVSFADDGSEDTNKPILKNRRSSLEDVIRTHSPDGQIQGILKRKMSKEEEHVTDDVSNGSPEPHGILKRKSNSSSSSSTTSSHVSIAQAVLLAAAGGAEIVDDDKETMRPILKKKSFSEERPCLEVHTSETPRPILKKKSLEHDEHEFELPKKPILKVSKKLSSDDGHASSFDLSEDDRSSRRPSLLRSRTSDHSGSECEATVKPILKQRGSSLTRERSQSPRPRLSFCADSDANISVTNFSSDANDLVAGPSRLANISAPEQVESAVTYPSAVLRRRDLRPKDSQRSKTLTGDVNNELLRILHNRRSKVEENCRNGSCRPLDPYAQQTNDTPKTFPSIASRIKSMEQALTRESLLPKDLPSISKPRIRDRDRHKTQPVTVEEMRSITSSLESGQASFQAFGPISGSFPSRPAESTALFSRVPESERDLFADIAKSLDSPPFGTSAKQSVQAVNGVIAKEDSIGEATFLDFESCGVTLERRQSTLDEIEQEVNKVRVALDEDCRALDEDERQQAEADNWSLNVSCDSGVYNRASSRDSGPHSGEELGLIESQEIKENLETNSSAHDWSSSVERDLVTMDRQRKSSEMDEARSLDDQGSDDENNHSGFALGLVKSNSVVARASMWQQLQQQAKGSPKPLVRYNRSRTKELPPVSDRFKSQTNQFHPASPPADEGFSLAPSRSTANVLEKDEDAKLDEDDPAKLSLMEKMKMFNSKLTHKPPVSGLPKREDRSRASRLRTMPVLASQVQEAMETNERLTKSLTHEDVPRNPDFQLKMELFRSASAKNMPLQHLMRQNAKFRSLDLDDDSPSPTERAQRMITPEVRGILKSGSTVVPDKPKTLTKGESSEGLKDEGIDSSSDDESSASSVSTSEKSCLSSDSSEDIPGPKPRRIQARKNNKLKASRTDSDLTRVLATKDQFPMKVQLPGANELKERFAAKNAEVKTPLLGKLGRKNSEMKEEEDDKNPRYKRFVKKLEEPIQLGKLRRPLDKTMPPPMPPRIDDKPPTVLKICALNQEAKNKFFGIDPKKEKTIDELTAAVRKYIAPVSKSISTHTMEMEHGGSGSDGESSGGREVRHINTRGRHRTGGVQRSATNADMPNRGNTIAERLAALQAAGANDWRARVCRLSPEKEDSKAIERAKNKINENLNTAVDEKKKVQIEESELSSNILADRRTKLETAAQGWRKRVPQNDASLFTVAGRLERDKVTTNSSPPKTPPPVGIPPAPASPGIPTPNKFRSRKQPSSPTNNGFSSGPLRSASCAVVSAVADTKLAAPRPDRESFKRSHSVSESIALSGEKEENSIGAEKTGSTVRVPRADDETFHAFFTPVLQKQERTPEADLDLDLDLDAIDSGPRQLLASDWARRAKRERRHVASRNPLKALAARTDILEEYSPAPSTIREQYIKEKVTANCGLAAEALAALATKEDFSNVSLKSAASAAPTTQGTKPIMLLHVKGRRRVQTRLVEPVHTSVNRGDCFVLITPDQVFQYIGLYSNVIERNRSSDIALHIHNTKDLGCKNSTAVLTIDEQSKSFSNKHWNQFWSLLGVTDGIEEYKPVETGHADEDEIYESCIIQTNMCYEVMDDELVPIKEYWGQMPKIAMLHQSKVIVFDFGSEMYIWYGKNVPLESRRRAAQLAQEMFDDGYNYTDCHINPLDAAGFQGARQESNSSERTATSRPKWAIISKITQHMETILFKEKFLDWPDYSRVIRVKPQENRSNSTEITPCDADEMWANDYQDPDLILEGSHVGRGTHYYDKEAMKHFDIKTRSVTKWVIQEYDSQKVENATEIGDFFSADSYIIRWEYQITAVGRELNGKPSKHNITGRDRCAYFCWQGRDATSNEKGAAALLTVELDKEKGPQLRVAQGNEPAAFLNLFQGNLVVHQGKKDIDKTRYRLFVTRGNLSNEAYLLQVPCSVRQLRSRGSLLLVDSENGCLYIWHGARSLKHTKNIAIELANKLIARKSDYMFGLNSSDIKITEVKEGEEPKEVLDALGGANKQYYNSVLSGSKEGGSDVTPRMFHFTDLGGQFEANEVLSPLRHERLVTPFPFEQKELYTASQPALFLLDDGKALWLWQGWWPRGDDGEFESAEVTTGVGAFAARWQAMRAAALRTAEAYWRKASTARPDVRVVAAGLEPATFTDLFDCWREHDEAAIANINHGYKAGEVLSGACELSRLTSCDAIVPLAALQRRPLPDHVDPQHLERHLSSPDFTEAFGMTKEEFSGLPAWKQTNMKKDIGLF